MRKQHKYPNILFITNGLSEQFKSKSRIKLDYFSIFKHFLGHYLVHNAVHYLI